MWLFASGGGHDSSFDKNVITVQEFGRNVCFSQTSAGSSVRCRTLRVNKQHHQHLMQTEHRLCEAANYWRSRRGRVALCGSLTFQVRMDQGAPGPSVSDRDCAHGLSPFLCLSVFSATINWCCWWIEPILLLCVCLCACVWDRESSNCCEL